MKMSKNNLKVGVIYVLLGCLLAVYAILTPESKLNSLLFGFAFALITPGLMMIGKFFYWSRPENIPKYQEKIRRENIILHDELQVKLRDRSGRITFLFGLCAISASMVVFSILGALDIVASSRLIIFYLAGYIVFQIITYLFIYYKLSKRY
jgi:hypothetical protein